MRKIKGSKEASDQILKENKKLKNQNIRLRRMLEKNKKQHQKWEKIAACYHDILWKVLLKYEPDTYGVLYPDRKPEQETIDLKTLPKIEK